MGMEYSSSLRAIEPRVQTPLDAARSELKNADETRVRADTEAFKFQDRRCSSTLSWAITRPAASVELLRVTLLGLSGMSPASWSIARA